MESPKKMARRTDLTSSCGATEVISRRVIYYGAVCLLAIVAILWAVNAANNVLSYVPFTSQWNERRAAAKVPGLEADVSRLEREASGNAEIGQAVQTYHTREVIYRDIQTQAEIEARNAPDAETPLSDERANRLRRHDASVCLSAPAICPPADPAGSRP